MLGDINLDLTPIEYDIQICKPNRMVIGNVSEKFNISYKGKLESIDEIDFDVPYYIEDKNFIKTKNSNWDKLLGDYLLFVNEEKYFVIDIPSESGGDGLDIKHIHAYSYEYSLRQKLLRGFQVTRELYDTTENKAGVLNQFEADTTWKVGHIDNTLVFDANNQKIYRTFDISEKSWLKFIREDLKKAFNCIAIFDTVNKLINLYDIDTYGQNKGLNISEANYLKTIKKEIKHDDIVTQLKIYGYNNISIQEVNPLGTDYLEDFSYYKTNHMDNNLINALNTYESLVKNNQGTFTSYLTSLDTLNTTLNVKQVELTTLKGELKIIQDNIDIAITQGNSLSALNTEKTNKTNQINAKQLEIDGVNAQISIVRTNIITLKNLLDKKNNFTLEQLEQLDFFTKTQTWQNETISYANELYIAGKKELQKRNTPPVQFNIDIVDFLKIIKFQHDWHKLILGDLINIEYTTFDTNIEVRLISYTHDYDNNSLTIEFSNKDDIKTDVSELRDILSNSVNANTTMSMNKSYWDYGLDNKNQIASIMNSELNTARNRVVCGDKQKIWIDEHGIHLSEFGNENEQVRLLNNCISITEDGWQTSALAINGKGIFAKNLVGEIIAGNKLMITNDVGNFTIDQNGIKATNMDLTLKRANSTIKISPTDGIKIQKSGMDVFHVDADGTLILDDVVTNNVTANYGIYNNIVATLMKTSNSSNYTILHDQYMDFYNGNSKLGSLGYAPDPNYNGGEYDFGLINPRCSFTTYPGGGGFDLRSEGWNYFWGNCDFRGNLTKGSEWVATEEWVNSQGFTTGGDYATNSDVNNQLDAMWQACISTFAPL